MSVSLSVSLGGGYGDDRAYSKDKRCADLWKGFGFSGTPFFAFRGTV